MLSQYRYMLTLQSQCVDGFFLSYLSVFKVEKSITVLLQGQVKFTQLVVFLREESADELSSLFSYNRAGYQQTQREVRRSRGLISRH